MTFPGRTAAGNGPGALALDYVLQIPELDIFDGIAVKTKHGLRFVDRDQVTEMTTTLVRGALTDDEAANLPAPKGALVLHPEPPR